MGPARKESMPAGLKNQNRLGQPFYRGVPVLAFFCYKKLCTLQVRFIVSAESSVVKKGVRHE
jgi:hypothetical protein